MSLYRHDRSQQITHLKHNQMLSFVRAIEGDEKGKYTFQLFSSSNQWDSH